MYSVNLFGLFSILVVVAARDITFNNRCSTPIWINPFTSNNGPTLPGGIQRLNNGASYKYTIPSDQWQGRFWPKTGCDGSGQNCVVGQSVDPCGPQGCEPPADTKVEFFFPASGSTGQSWYDISLVDGYSLPMEIIPSQQGGSCVQTNCHISLSNCPTNENSVGDLRVQKNGQTVQCLSPCKKWNYPAPYGLGKPENQGDGLQFCCPTPPIQPAQCQSGIVVQTKYVSLVRQNCPSAYSYAYDDAAGLHNCPGSTNFVVNVC